MTINIFDSFLTRQTVDGVSEYDELLLSVAGLDLSNASYYTLTTSDIGRLDKIATNHYGSPAYYFILSRVNNIVDHLEDMNEGDIITLPDKDTIDLFIESIKEIKYTLEDSN